jgi:YebC/PmpR family DNA-binding regulatory protein
MSGHNRWTKIKRKKEAMGATKGKLFSKLIKEITVAAKTGGGDPVANARLRVILSLAREGNIPGDTIQRAIKKGTGELEGVNYEEITYEGYGPGGVAMLVECLTDNRNRTASDLRATWAKSGGHMASDGAVSWVFQKKGLIVVKPGLTEEQLMERALDAGAEDVSALGSDGFEVKTAPADLHAVGLALERAGLKLGEQKWIFVPQTTVKLEGEPAQKMLRLMEHLEDSDDVQNVHANFEIDEAVMEQWAQ